MTSKITADQLSALSYTIACQLALAGEPGLSAADKRVRLRTAFEMAVVYGIHDEANVTASIRDAFDHSAKIKGLSSPPRPTLAGLRDYLSPAALVRVADAAAIVCTDVGHDGFAPLHGRLADPLAAVKSAPALEVDVISAFSRVLKRIKTQGHGHALGEPEDIAKESGGRWKNPQHYVNSMLKLYREHVEFDRPRYDKALALVQKGARLPDEIGKSRSEASTTDNNEVTKPMTATAKIDPAQASMLNAVLAAAGQPPIEILLDKAAIAEQLPKEIAELKAKLASSSAMKMPDIKIDPAAAGELKIPEGKVVFKPAHEVFGLPPSAKEHFGFDVPTFEWAGDHPHVPDIDEDYLFRPDSLAAILWALITNKKAWLQGHTGSGKTTLVEQVCARMRWPVLRVNFDSEITRMDLIGRDTLVNDGGVTKSHFIDGILPTALAGPYVLLCDEVSFIRPDVAYVFQRALEDKGLLITEDGGRLVRPHKLFRLIATDNTVGQGDEFGMYQGARPQSLAFLDRFTCFIKVDFLSTADELKLLKKRLPDLDDELAKKVVKYTDEHRTAFTKADVTQPISPRGVKAFGEALIAFTAMFPSNTGKAVQMAAKAVLVDRANEQDRATLVGIINRVFGVSV